MDAHDWEQRYQAGSSYWDLGQPAPPLKNFLAKDILLPGKIAVPGCGRGYDALAFAEKGFEVVGFDFAETAIREAKVLATSDSLTAKFPPLFLQRDIFNLESEFLGRFDYVLEHTCFCAITVEQRLSYVRLVHQLLKPKGELIGIFFTHDRFGGPPFGTNPQEICQLWEPYFEILALTPAMDSIPQRQGEEHLAHFRRK